MSSKADYGTFVIIEDLGSLEPSQVINSEGQPILSVIYNGDHNAVMTNLAGAVLTLVPGKMVQIDLGLPLNAIYSVQGTGAGTSGYYIFVIGKRYAD